MLTIPYKFTKAILLLLPIFTVLTNGSFVPIFIVLPFRFVVVITDPDEFRLIVDPYKFNTSVSVERPIAKVVPEAVEVRVSAKSVCPVASLRPAFAFTAPLKVFALLPVWVNEPL